MKKYKALVKYLSNGKKFDAKSKDKIPAIIAQTKNITTLCKTTEILTDESAKLVMIVKATIPKISSIIAAPNIAFPARVFNLPNSFKVSTVILTEVAVKIIPIKIFCNISRCAGFLHPSPAHRYHGPILFSKILEIPIYLLKKISYNIMR